MIGMGGKRVCCVAGSCEGGVMLLLEGWGGRGWWHSLLYAMFTVLTAGSTCSDRLRLVKR